MPHLRIRVDQTKCVASTTCVHTAPGVFALDATGKSSVADPHGETAEKIWEAAEGCPMSAIILEDTETGEQLFP